MSLILVMIRLVERIMNKPSAAVSVVIVLAHFLSSSLRHHTCKPHVSSVVSTLKLKAADQPSVQ